MNEVGTAFVMPNDKKSKPPRYATYTAGVGMKLFKSLGSAKQSLVNQLSYWNNTSLTKEEGFILELVEGEYFVLFWVPEGTAFQEFPWKRKVWVSNQYGFRWKTDVEPKNPELYYIQYESVPMTREEYAEWRVKVERERNFYA